MKFKKEIIAIMLIICMLFTITAISAADSSTDAVGVTNTTVEVKSVDNGNSLGMQNDVESLGDGETDDGTFTNLSSKITNPSGTIVNLWNNYTFDASSSVITISTDNLVIDGHGVTTIDAKRYSGIFEVVANSVTIKNIKFINGYSTGSYSAGAISSSEYSVNIENCTFIDNEASGQYSAGAIYTYYANSIIKDCTFINNKGSYVGAIFWQYAWDTIEKCIFINNTGNTAGAISVYSWEATNIKNSIFINNAGGNEIYGYKYWQAINANYNWFGTTIDNYETNAPNVNSDVTLGGYYVLNLELDNDNGKAIASLNNLYENGVLNTNYATYELPTINLNVKGKNIEVEDSVSLVDGVGTIDFTPADAYAITVSYNGVELTREVKPTFSLLNNKINAECSEISLDQDYIYDSTKDSSLTNGIEFAKDMTIDGQGHIIDAKESTNIFYFNDNTDSYSLTLKNIIFANATGTNGAAVYFNGKKIEIINCTFINNNADSEGDAVYIADASSTSNKITESLFANNIGDNSVAYINLDSNARLDITNSIFAGNDASKNIKGTSNVIAEHNWFGNTMENYDDVTASKIEGVTVNNWLFLKIDADAVMTGDVSLSLNNVYDGSDIATYDEYSLKPITLALGGSNVGLGVPSVTLNDGQATYKFAMYKTTASLTATYGDITTAKELEYTIVDDGSFKALNEIIWFSKNTNNVIELTHDYVYSDSDNITEGILIPRTMTINGNGYTIDAKGKTRIFDINRGVSNVNINDINFVNAKSSYGSAITIEYHSDYCKIFNCNFTNNTATTHGGAVDITGDYSTIENCNFINNSAVSYGGAILYNPDTQSYIKNSNFINNSVNEGGSGGGAIYGDDGRISISKSTFFDNSAKNMLGGTIYAKKAITISDSIILNSTGNYDIYDAYGITIQNSWVGNTFDNYNSAPNVYYLSSSSWLYLNIKFYEDFAIVSLNEAYASSSGSSSVYSGYNLPEITLNINSTSLDLGGIDKITFDSTGKAIVPFTKISEDAKLTVSNEYVSLTKDCNVGDFDCLQYLIDSSTGNTIELTRNYTFTEGVDTLINGISITRDITIDGKGFTINGSNLARIFYITTNGVTLKNINFVNGYASHGGAIYNNGGSGFKLINCTFENNVAYNNPGGAIYTYSNGVNDFINCTFIGNKMTKSGQYGGAVYIFEYSGRNNFIGCTFINNSAYYGGAIATASGQAITNVEKSVFVTNTANYYSSIYIKGGASAEFYLKNSIIFSKGFTTDTSTQVYVASALGAGDVDYNWWMHTSDNYKQNAYIHCSGGGITVNKWLYLDLICENDVATVSLNNLYDKSTTTSSTYDGELPQITFDLSAVNAIVDSNVTLDKNGQGEVEYIITGQTASLTATYNSVSITKSLEYDYSFTTLQSKINRASEDSQIVLNHDYNYDSTKDSSLIGGIVIDKDLTIDGQGYTIDAKNAARIFNINNASANIVLKNINFVNAVGDNGAAIYANCNNIEIINCTFENNTAAANGDALYLVANSCDITESAFVNNIGTVSTIYLDSESDDATFNIANSILVNNGGTNIVKTKGVLTADYNWWGNTVEDTNDLSDGLAQKWYVLDMAVDDSQSVASISLNNLNDGTSYEDYALPQITLNMQATNGAVRKDEITLDENGDAKADYLATDDGASVTVSYNGVSLTREISYNEESDYSFKALRKLINQAQDNGNITLTHDYEYVVGYDNITTGSDTAITEGIDITQNNLTINGNGFTIDAKGKTRVFNIGKADYLYASNVTIANTTFVNGKFGSQGGAIKWCGWNGTLINCTFENNSASSYGGAVYWYGQNANVTNCTFKNNILTSNYNGGAIYLQSQNAYIFNSTFSGSKASNGGAISVNSKNVIIEKSTFIKNKDSSNGGAINVAGNNLTILNSTFIENSATIYGGAIYWYSGDMGNIINSTFNDNYADSQGGAIYWNIKLNVTNSTFENNKAKTSGGAIYCNNNGGTIFNSTFINNNAVKGGVIYIFNGELDINETDFVNNTASATGSTASYGSVIYTDAFCEKIEITNSSFINNGVTSERGHAYAGVMYLKYGKINITNSTFDKNYIASNSGTTYGSIFYWSSTDNAEINNCSFLNSYGKSSQGAPFYLSGSNVKVNVSNSICLNNTYGSSTTLTVVYKSSGSIVFNFCWFGNNKTGGYGSEGISPSYVANPLCLIADHDDYMAVGEDRQIKYLFKYFEDGNTILYDSSKLPKVNLTLSSVNGDIDRNSASMDESILFNANHFGSASITAKYNGMEYTEKLYAKDKPTITVEEPIIVHVGESVAVNIVELIPSDASLSFSGIDGDEVIMVMGNGYVEGLKEGTSTLYIKYNGNDNYSPKTVEVPVTVIKYNTQINTKIDSTPVDSITVDWGADPQSIVVSFATDDPNPQFDEFDLKVNDTNVARFTANPNLITFGTAGTANVTFYFEGSNRYYGCEKNITVTVKKVHSSIEFSRDVEFDYLSSGTTTLTLVGCTVDDTNIVVLDHSEAVIGYENNVITVSGLDAGTYTLKVTTTPDENHTSVEGTASITVNKIDSSVVFSGDVEFDYLSSGTTTLTLDGCTVSVDNIVVEGKEANIQYNPDTNVVTVSGLDAGTYTLKVTTTPDSNYKSVDATAEITVNKIDSSVGFTNSVVFDYLSSGTTTLIDYVGCSVDEANITVVDHSEAVIGFENNVITVSGLGAGTYTLKVITTPDSNYKSVDATADITVNKIASSITLSNTDIVYKYDESNTTTLTLVGCSVDVAGITVDGITVEGVSYDSETKVITISGLDVGSHTLRVVTTPDENHTSAEATASITVEKSNSSVKFSNPISLFFSESGTTTLILNGCTINLDDISVVGHDEAIIAYDSQTNVVTVSNLAVGTYTLKVVTTPDSNHLSVENTTTVTVGKESPKLEMEYSNVTVGENVYVYVSMKIAGEVKITIDGIEPVNVTIGDSRFNKTIFAGLKVGTYDITAYYKGQGKYNDSTLKYKLVIHPIYEYEATATANNTVWGDKTNVTVTLPGDATGEIKIGDTPYEIKGTETLIDLGVQSKVGKNNITVQYVPDPESKYAARNFTVLYDVAKADTNIAIAIDPGTGISAGDTVTITATIKAEGNVTFIVNDKTYSKKIIEGKATLELSDVDGGKYNVTAVYAGNDNYINSSANSSYIVDKLDSVISDIELDNDAVKTNETATVTVTVPGSGIVTFTVNGKEINVTVNEEHKAILILSNLTKGETTIKAKYLGDGKYKPSEEKQKTLAVNPIAVSKFEIDAANITVGENATVYVFLSSDATGKVNITVSNATVKISRNVSIDAAGFNKTIFAGLKVGKYDITAKYYGDGKYDEKQIKTEFIVNPLNVGKLNFTVSVNDTFVGKTTNVTVTLPSDAKGQLVIDGKPYDITGVKTIINLTDPQTKAGINNITVRYVPESGSKYAEENVTAFYNVAKNVATITIGDIIDKKAGSDVDITVDANYVGAEIVVLVDGEEKTLTNGKVTIENITAGTHTIVASVAETGEYLSATANKTFTVTKTNGALQSVVCLEDIHGEDVFVGEKVTIEVGIADDATGIVVVNVNGTKYSLNITESKTFQVVVDNPGKVQLSAEYLGDYKYSPMNKTNPNKFDVKDKVTPSITIEVDSNYVVGDEVNIKVNTNGDNLTVVVLLNKEEIKKETSNNFVFTPAKDGAYTIIARTTENKTHYASENITSFTVAKKASSIEVNGIKDVKVGEEIRFTVSSKPANPIVKINGVVITPTNGEYKFTPKTSGKYTLNVETEGNEQYIGGIKTQTFTATKNDVSLSVSANPVKVGEKSTITVNINNDATGIVIVKVDATEYSLNISESRTLKVLMNRVDNISISAKYAGDDKYNAKDSEIKYVEVSDKITPNIEIEVDPVTAVIGDDVNIKVTTNGDNLIVLVYLGDNLVKSSGDTTFVFAPAKDGSYTVIARTSENGTHHAGEKVASFTVINKTKQAPTISVSQIKDAKVGEELTFTVSSDVAGAVVKIDDEKITPVGGVYKYTPQTGGKHILTVETPEDGKHSKGLATQTFDVAKKQPDIQISTEGDLIVDKNIKLNIKSYDGAKIVVFMDGKQLDNWESSFKTTAGEHLVIASVAENDQYLASSKNYTFDVARKESSISVSGSQTVVGGTSTIDVEITNGATGMAIVNVGGVEYSMNVSKSKSLSVVLSNPGTYDIFARYLGDDNYLPSESNANTLVVKDKDKTTIEIGIPSAVYAGDDVTVEVISNNGAIEVYFDGVKQTLKDGEFTVKGIKAGSHEISVTGPETSEFKFNTTSKAFTVEKKASEVTITLPKTINVGQDVTIEFTSTGGDIKAYIDGVKQTLTNGKVTIKATAGVHTVIASVDENDKYLASAANRTFTVDKLVSQIAVSGVDIVEGQSSKITIDTNINEGTVIVKVGDIQAAVDLAKTKSVDVKIDAPGTYELSASYLGSDIYKPAEASKSAIKVQSKQAPKVDVSIPEIKAGESKPISISIENATGNVHVIVDGVDNVVPLDGNGKASYTPDKMGAGEHSVVVVYEGDDANGPAIASKAFDVSKQTTKASITTPSNVKEGEDATVKVEIPGATGDVSVIVDGKENKVALVNGACDYPLNNLSGGDHSVVVVYPGDDEHDATYSASSFTVAKKPVIVPKASEFSDITIDDDLLISFILKDEDGNPIRNAVINYNDGSDKTTKTDYHGKFTIQAVNDALIIIKYNGTDSITGTNTALKLSLPTAPVSEKLTSRFNITDNAITINGYAVDTKAGERGMTYATKLLDDEGKPVSNALIQFAVNNKIYNRTTKADGSFDPYHLDMLRAGRYTMAFSFGGNDNYTSTFAVVCVDLDKKPITIKASSKTFKATAKTKKLTVTLKTVVGSSLDGKIYLSKGKTVTLDINGKTYTGSTNENGKVTFKLTNLARGIYTAKIKFEGDMTYEAQSKSVKITVV